MKAISTLHKEHNTWLNILTFYKDDLKILQKRVTQVACYNTNKEVLAYTDYYKEEIRKRHDEASALVNEIEQHDRLLSKKLDKDNHKQTAPDHPLHRKHIKAFEKKVNKLRLELNTFASRWM